MTTAIRRAARRSAPASRQATARTLGGRSALPRGRAVLGALLVAVSAVGLLVAHQAATRTDEQLWLVATHDVAFGARITSDDLTLAPMHLYSTTASRAFRDGHGVVGRIARSPIAAGDLVQRGAVQPTETPSGPARRRPLRLAHGAGARDIAGADPEVRLAVAPERGAAEARQPDLRASHMVHGRGNRSGQCAHRSASAAGYRERGLRSA